MAKTLLLQGIKCQKKCDLTSAGGQHIKLWIRGNFLIYLVSEDHVTIFLKQNQFMICSWMNAWESIICLCFECIYECMTYFLMFGRFDFSTKEWMHDFMLMHEILTHMRFFTFNAWGFWFVILLLSLNQLFL